MTVQNTAPDAGNEASVPAETTSQTTEADLSTVQPDAPEQPSAGGEQQSDQPAANSAEACSDDPLAGLHPDDPEAAAKFGKPTDEECENSDSDDGTPPAEEPIDVNLPDGFVVDEEAMGGFKEVLKTSESKQDMAQKLMDIHIAEQRKLVQGIETKLYADAARQNAEWATQCRNDPDFGGSNYEASCNYVTKAISDFVPVEERAEFVDVFRKLQLQNQPHLRRFLVRVGMAHAESGPVNSGGGTPLPKPLAAKMFSHIKE